MAPVRFQQMLLGTLHSHACTQQAKHQLLHHGTDTWLTCAGARALVFALASDPGLQAFELPPQGPHLHSGADVSPCLPSGQSRAEALVEGGKTVGMECSMGPCLTL